MSKSGTKPGAGQAADERARDHKPARRRGNPNNSVDDISETDGDRYPGDVSEEIFWDVADAFIELANNAQAADHPGGEIPVETVNAALMYASARYSAFVAVNQHAQSARDDADQFDANTVGEYFSLQFRKLFDENIAQYVDAPDVAESDPDTDAGSDSS